MKKPRDGGVAEVVKTENIAVVDAQETALRTIVADTFAPMEGFSKDSVEGKEGITGEDWKPDFLCIAQKTSKALDDTEDAYIDGLRFGDLYNSTTKEIYGRGPLPVILLRHRKSAFIPDANGRRGEEIPWNDERCDWPDEDEKKNWVADGKKGKPKPEGVREYNWVALLMVSGFPQLVIISFRSKSFSAGQTLTKFAGMVQGPVYTAKFTVESQLTENEAGKFGVFAVRAAGKPTMEEAKYAAKIYSQIKDKEIPTESQTTEVDDAHEVVDAAPIKTDDTIPF